MSAALAYRPDRSEAALVFQMKEGAYNTDSLIEFLEEFHTHFAGEKVTLIWDGLPSHRSKAMKAWIATQRARSGSFRTPVPIDSVHRFRSFRTPGRAGGACSAGVR